MNKRILLKALRKFPVYEFSRLKSYFPLLKSHSEFLSSKDYAGRYEFVTITSGEPTNEDIYQGALRLFEILSNKILSIKAPLQGTPCPCSFAANSRSDVSSTSIIYRKL